MKTFDYAAAWREVVCPAFLVLPESVFRAAAWTMVVADDVHQSSALGMNWPSPEVQGKAFGKLGVPRSGEFRNVFEQVPDLDLARSAWIVNSFGHLRGGDWPGEAIEKLGSALAGENASVFVKGNARNAVRACAGNGWWWKFAKYADDVIGDRIDRVFGEAPSLVLLEKHVLKVSRAVSMRIDDGKLKLSIDLVNGSEIEDLGIVTSDLVRAAVGVAPPEDQESLDEALAALGAKVEPKRIEPTPEEDAVLMKGVISRRGVLNFSEKVVHLSRRKYEVRISRDGNSFTVPFECGPAKYDIVQDNVQLFRTRRRKAEAKDPPSAKSVVECVLFDSESARSYESFESWCSAFGYDSDSRKAEAIYESCKSMLVHLVRVFGQDLERLRKTQVNDEVAEAKVKAYVAAVRAACAPFVVSGFDLSAYDQ